MSLIAQMAAENPLASYGIVGVVMGWLMWLVSALRSDIKDFRADIKDSAHRLDGLSRTMLVDMLERENTGAHTKQYCREAIARIDARASKDAEK